MSAVLTTHNAEIKTATVEIRTLTVTGKQVTLAVFRQLIEAPVVARDGLFNGVPWGTVNYHPDKCADLSTHLHVVWQDGTELRRSYVTPPRFGGAVDCPSGERWLDAAILAGWRPREERYVDNLHVKFPAGTAWLITSEKGVREALWPSSWIPDAREQGLAQIRERSGDDIEVELRATVELEVEAEMQRRARHQARWAELTALPQLFIAV